MVEENGQMGFDDLEAIKTGAIDQVEDNADDEWMTIAYQIAAGVARSKRRFTTDDIWVALDVIVETGTHERRAMGAVMRQIDREGLARPTSEYVQSVRPVRHRGPIRVWWSYIFEETLR